MPYYNITGGKHQKAEPKEKEVQTLTKEKKRTNERKNTKEK